MIIFPNFLTYHEVYIAHEALKESIWICVHSYNNIAVVSPFQNFAIAQGKTNGCDALFVGSYYQLKRIWLYVQNMYKDSATVYRNQQFSDTPKWTAMKLITTLRYDQRFTRIKRNQKQIKKKYKIPWSYLILSK